MEPSRKRDCDRTANRSNGRENVRAMSGQIVTKDCSVRKTGGINPATIDVVILLSLRKYRVDKSDIVDSIQVGFSSVVQASIVPVSFVGFRKNDQGMVELAYLCKARNSGDRIDPVTGSFGSMEDKNNRDRVRQI